MVDCEYFCHGVKTKQFNFFVQKKYAFQSDGGYLKAGLWYFIAYCIITIIAGALQGLYKAPIYAVLIENIPNGGEQIADVVTMMINSVISFLVFFPILKIIFKSSN